MRITFHKDDNAAYIYLTDSEAETRYGFSYPCDPKDVKGILNLDFNDAGQLYGIEVLDASHKLPKTLLDMADTTE